jgi:hypothetical protein
MFTLRGKLESWGFFLGGGILFAVPVQSGFMKDHDFPIPGSDAVSHYSRYDVYLDKHFDTTGELGYTYVPPFGWSMVLSGGFLYRNCKWTAANGYCGQSLDTVCPASPGQKNSLTKRPGCLRFRKRRLIPP